LKFIYIFFLSFFSLQLYAQNNLNPLYVSMISPQNMYHQNLYIENDIDNKDSAIQTCEVEKEGFFSSLFDINEDQEKTFLGVELDYIKLGMSLVSLGIDFVIPIE